MDEDDLAWIAEGDQAQARAKTAVLALAKLIAGYYRALVDLGVEPEFAISLALAYQDTLLRGVSRQD